MRVRYIIVFMSVLFYLFILIINVPSGAHVSKNNVFLQFYAFYSDEK